MNITQNDEANHKTNDQLWQKQSGIRLLILVAMSLFIGNTAATAQTTVQLPQLVIEAKHTEYATTGAPSTAAVSKVSSSNPSVATARAYRVTSVQIVAVAPGKTEVEFWDMASKTRYIVPVWVTAPNPTGGGGAGYNPRLTQLPQIVMLVNRTENAHTPSDAAAKISGVTSSNPSVATARTDLPRGIQIYSKALGDTWIDFTNNTTGITYQVHVWVRNSLDFIPPSPGPNPNPKPGPGPKPRPKPQPKPLPGPVSLRDKCLIGTWRSETVVYDYGPGTISPRTGGAGIIFTVEDDGSVTIDYNKMEPFKVGGNHRLETTTTWSGTAAGHIKIKDEIALLVSVERSELTYKTTDGRTTSSHQIKDLGPALMVNYPYTCNETTLNFKPGQVISYTFKREKKEP